MDKEYTYQKISSELIRIEEKMDELLSEGRKLLRQHNPSKDVSNIFNEILSLYRKYQMRKEFCEYCLMYAYVADEV